MKKIALVLVSITLIWKVFFHEGEVILGPGVMAAEEPIQQRLTSQVIHTIDDYTINEVATFEITAKVLSRKNYYTGRQSDLSPTDFTLGWGNMSDESILEHINITQSSRFYYWRVQSFPIPRKEIESHSANMHLIPADDSVKRLIGDVKKGDIIQLTGSLVNVTAQDGNWYWRSSQTRNDTGGGACELIWVTNIQIVTP